MSSKLYHGLVSSDLNPKDHQNYPSCVRISRDEIFRALEKVNDSRATIVYIKLLRSVIDAYIEESTTILDRVFHAWTSVFLSRLWLLWIQKMGKKKLDDIFTELTKHSNKHDHRSKTTAQQYFLTPQAVYSIELNAHCLVYLILLVIEGKLPEDVLLVERFHSQSCESVFRSARALSSNSSSGVNFSVSQFLNLIDRLSLFQKIKTEHEQGGHPMLRFPLHHKNKHGSSSLNRTAHMKLPTRVEIEQTVVRAFGNAKDHLEQVGIMAVLRRNKLGGIVAANNYARTLFDDKEILDFFSQENGDDDEDEWRVPAAEDDAADDDGDDEDFGSLQIDDESDSARPTFRTMRVCDHVPTHLLPSYFKVRINDKEKFLHKSTATWILTEQNRKISADRTRRVTQAR